MAKASDTDGTLKRLGGGRWQTRDERFSIEPQSGTWVVVDSEQADDLGLPRIRGPFGSLGAAKDAIAAARETEPALSPLAAKLAELRERPRSIPRTLPTGPSAKTEPKPRSKPKLVEPAPPPEPKWIRDLGPSDRRRAHELIDRLVKAGIADSEGVARRDLVGKVPAVAVVALDRAVAALGEDASPAEILRLLTDGKDEELGVRWRLVDGDDRPIRP